jgi:4-hydroxy-tetrahydrodipicolinate reductase
MSPMSWVSPLRIGVIGAGGRLGSEIVALASENNCTVALRGLRQEWITSGTPDVIIDASHDTAFESVLAYCCEESVPLVEAVSSLAPEQIEQLATLGRAVGVVHAPNLSYGNHLQHAVLLTLAHLLRDASCGWECTIMERHPTFKRDRPSATARRLARTWSDESGRGVSDVAAVRGGLPVSDHELTVTLAGETVTVKHSVTDRRAAASGALKAAQWLVTKPPGLYTMTDVYVSEKEKPNG